MRNFLSLLLILIAATPVFAHEGHGHTEGFTITHYFVEPEHAIPIAIALVLAIVVARKLVRSFTKK